MNRASPRELRDLADVLDEIRALPDIVERKSGVFYLRRLPFLHFHTTGPGRRAHAKIGATWGPEIPIPFGATARAKAAFLREVRKRHKATAAARRTSS